METNQNFEPSDGWLFATLKILENGPLKLKHIISIGDTLNHAIFTLDEINEGLSRLESEQFIQIRKGKVYFTNKAKAFIQNNRVKFEGCINEQVRYANLFKEIPLKNKPLYQQYFTPLEYAVVLKKRLK